jgi:hypothetical protein
MRIERELDYLIPGKRAYFTFTDIRKVREAVDRDGADPDSVRLEFIRRTDLSGNPHYLYATYEREAREGEVVS